MSEIQYTNPGDVLEVFADDDAPRYGQSVTGYGPKIPTRYRIRYATPSGARVLRVYMAQYGNSGSAYVCSGGVDLYLDTDTEYALQDAR